MTDSSDIFTEIVSKKDLGNLIKGRRSLFPMQYTGEKISDDVVLEILEYANAAPNHKLTRPWRFIVYSGDSKNDLIDQMKDYYLMNTAEADIKKKKLDAFEFKKERTSHIIGIAMHRDEAERVPEMEEIAAVSCAVQNIYLSLNTFGLGGYWSTGKYSFSKEAANYMELGERDKCLGFFFLGKVDVKLPLPQRDSVQQKVIWKK